MVTAYASDTSSTSPNSYSTSQGSERPAVVIPLATQHYTLLERNLLYP